MSSVKAPTFTFLTEDNYTTWEQDMGAHLRVNRLWRITIGAKTRPTPLQLTAPVAPVTVGTGASAVTTAGTPGTYDDTLGEAWDEIAEQAAGAIFSGISASVKPSVRDLLDDPVTMWSHLESQFRSKLASNRFNALDDTMSIRLKDEESLPAVSSRILDAVLEFKTLVPVGYDLDDMLNDLAIMSHVRCLPSEEFGDFTSQILMAPVVSIDSVTASFRQKESLLKRRAEPGIAGSALSTRVGAAPATTRAGIPPPGDACAFCAQASCPGKGDVCLCFFFIKYKKVNADYKESRRQEKRQDARPNRQAARQAAEAPGPTAASAQVLEADDASPRSSSIPPTSANTMWNTDTGATASMTPHRHWFQEYEPYRVPIRLATNVVVYSAGRGSVRFAPVLGGQRARPVLFTSVLHVPALKNNLLSVLHLTLLNL